MNVCICGGRSPEPTVATLRNFWGRKWRHRHTSATSQLHTCKFTTQDSFYGTTQLQPNKSSPRLRLTLHATTNTTTAPVQFSRSLTTYPCMEKSHTWGALQHCCTWVPWLEIITDYQHRGHTLYQEERANATIISVYKNCQGFMQYCCYVLCCVISAETMLLCG